MTKTRKLAPIAIGLGCAAALLGAVTYQDLSLRSRAAMELRGRIESAADAIAAGRSSGKTARTNARQGLASSDAI